MNHPTFASAWRKWNRGEQLRSVLERDFQRITEFVGDQSDLRFEHHQEEDRVRDGRRYSRITVQLGPDVPNLSEDFPLLLGEVIHNFRGAMDHLTWSLVRQFRAKLTVQDARQVQFPIHDSAADFEKRKSSRTPGLPDKPHRALLKRYQPYRRGAGPKAICWLRRLSNDDKHREVTPAIVAPRGVVVKASPGDSRVRVARIVPILTGPTPIKPGEPVADLHLVVEITPEADLVNVHVDTQFRLMPLLTRRVHAGGLLGDIAVTTREILEAFEALE